MANVEAFNTNLTETQLNNAFDRALSDYTDAQIDTLLAAKQDVLTFDTAPTEDSTNPVTSGGVFDAISAVTALHKAVVLDTGADLNNLYISQSPVAADCVTRKWVIPSATVGASLQHLPSSYKTVYANCEIEWHTVKNNGVGYQILTAGTNASFQRFMRFRNADGWGSWYTLFDTDNA